MKNPEKRSCLQGGITWLDHQHQMIFDLQEKIKLEVKSGDVTQFDTLMREYLKLCKEHFDLEEIYMAELGYTEFDAHKQSHEKFLKMVQLAFSNWTLAATLPLEQTIIEPSNQLKFNQIPTNVNTFFSFWNRQHSANFDMPLTRFLHKAQAS